MKTFFILFSLVFFGYNIYAQRNNPSKNEDLKSGFDYTEIGDFSDGSYLMFDIVPVRSMVYGNFQNVGLGAGINLNLSNKFSFDLDFAYNYFTYAWLESSYDYGIEKFKKNSSLEYGSTLGYTVFNKKSKKESSYTYLGQDKENHSIYYYAMLPATVSKSLLVQVGYKSIGMYNMSEPTFTQYNYDETFNTTTIASYPNTVKSLFQNNSIYCGLKYSEIIDTRYKTDIYGEVSSTSMREFYGGLLVGLKQKFPTICQYYRNDFYDVNNITDAVPISAASQQELESDYKFLPYGFKAGYMNSDKDSGLAFNWELAMYPGYCRSVLQQLSIRLAVIYRINKNFK